MSSTFEKARRIVVKVGTSTLTYATGMVNIRRVEKLVKVLSDIKNSGKEVVLVSSGAIAVGLARLGIVKRPDTTPEKQAIAAVGQCELMYLYDKLFSEYHHTVAQVLLTRDVVEQDIRRQHAKNAFAKLLEMNSIPIVNENDTVSVEEIEFGDNDSLSAMVGELIEADLLIILSDIDGLYDANPQVNPMAKIIEDVYEINDYIYSVSGEKGSERGTGGMITKINAAEIAMKNNIDMIIMNGNEPEQLYAIMDGEKIGTHFHAKEKQSNGKD